MTSLPLHPAIVHLPLGLAFVLPVLALGFAWALWTGRIRPRAWAAILALQAVLLGAGFVAMNTGETEEDRVAALVPDAALERHEVYAEQFLWATGIATGLTALVLMFPGAARGLAAASVAGTLVVAASALRVGHAGGQLVYVHNAGAAYAAPGVNARSGADTSRPRVAQKRDEGIDRPARGRIAIKVPN